MSDQLRASSSSDAASSAPQQVCHSIIGGINDHAVFALPIGYNQLLLQLLHALQLAVAAEVMMDAC